MKTYWRDSEYYHSWRGVNSYRVTQIFMVDYPMFSRIPPKHQFIKEWIDNNGSGSAWRDRIKKDEYNAHMESGTKKSLRFENVSST